MKLGKANAANRSLCINQVSEDEILHSWKLETHICLYKVFRFFKLDAHKEYAEVGGKNKQFTKLKF